MTRTEATIFLQDRYASLVGDYPRLARIPVGLYVQRNLTRAMALTPEWVKQLETRPRPSRLESSN